MCMVCLWCMSVICMHVCICDVCEYGICMIGMCVCIHYTCASKDQEAIGYSFEEYVWARPGSQQAPTILLIQTATLTPTPPR